MDGGKTSITIISLCSQFFFFERKMEFDFFFFLNKTQKILSRCEYIPQKKIDSKRNNELETPPYYLSHTPPPQLEPRFSPFLAGEKVADNVREPEFQDASSATAKHKVEEKGLYPLLSWRKKKKDYVTLKLVPPLCRYHPPKRRIGQVSSCCQVVQLAIHSGFHPQQTRDTHMVLIGLSRGRCPQSIPGRSR